MLLAALLSALVPVAVAAPPLSPLRVVHGFSPVGRYAAGDRGVDLAGVPGQRVVSATAGTVAFAGPVAGQGVVSIRLADGSVLTYEPVAPSVHAGNAMAAGAAIGRLDGGHLRCPAPACLHWGLRRPDGTYADPMALLGATRVRLLPLLRHGGLARASTVLRVSGPALGPPATSGPDDSTAAYSMTSTGASAGASPRLVASALVTASAGAAGAGLARRRAVGRRRPRDLRS